MVKSGSHRCPRCGRDTQYEDNPFRPFCSERCRLIDLGRWVSGTYRVPVEEAQDEQSASPKQDEESVKS
jgi:endogenous inhibitor of DNA gyrase (YacG/DUF329 family)